MWLKELKIAVIDRDIYKIQKLIQNVPEIKELSIAKEALALITQAIAIVDEEKKKTLEIMNKIKKTKAFLKS